MNDRVRELRTGLNMTRAAFGAKLGVSGDVINNIERGRAELKEPLLKLICSEYNVSEDWLRDGKGEMLRPTQSEAMDALLKEYDLTYQDYILIEKFVRSPAEIRSILEAFILETAELIRNAEQPITPGPVTTLNAAHERTDREVTEEDKSHDNALIDNCWKGIE